MVVDIGGGTSEVAVISLGDIVTEHVRFELPAITCDDRHHHLCAQRSITCSSVSARPSRSKSTIGSAVKHDAEDENSMEIRGRNLVDGLPKNVVIIRCRQDP